MSTKHSWSARLIAGLAGIAAAAAAGASPAGAVSGGSPLHDGRYAFVAKIVVGDSLACTAALVDPMWLLTARSCFAVGGQQVVAGAPAQPTTATVGRSDLTANTGHVTSVVEVRPHPRRNLALARLTTPVPAVTPASLATTVPTAGAALTIAGYGRTASEWVPDLLQSAPFAVRSVAPTTIDLTGQSASGTASLCKGDSGGPVVQQDGDAMRVVAVSTASSQNGCHGVTETGEAREGGVGTRVDDQGGWVREAMSRPYTLRNVATTRCADLPGYGAGRIAQQVYQYLCDNTSRDNQLWFFDARGRTADGQVLYSVRNAKDNLCLDLPAYGSVPAGTRVSQYYCGGPEDNQFVRLVKRAGGNWLVHDKSGLCLDVVAAPDNNGPLSLYHCSDTDDHIWTLGIAEWSNPSPSQSRVGGPTA